MAELVENEIEIFVEENLPVEENLVAEEDLPVEENLPVEEFFEPEKVENQKFFIIPLLYDILFLSNLTFFDENCTKIFCTAHFLDGSIKNYVVSEKSESGIKQHLYMYIITNEVDVNFYDENLKNIYLEDLKLEIENLKTKHNSGGVFALDHWWPTNLVTIPQWNYLRDMAREIKFDGGDMDAVMVDMDGNPFNWQTLDNGDIGLTANMVVIITNMGARNVNQNSQNAKRHITNLNASEHPEDYDYSDGWTDIYEG
jgi:hypothetical protein